MTGMMCWHTFRKISVCGVPSGPFTLCSSAVICTNREVDIWWKPIRLESVAQLLSRRSALLCSLQTVCDTCQVKRKRYQRSWFRNSPSWRRDKLMTELMMLTAWSHRLWDKSFAALPGLEWRMINGIGRVQWRTIWNFYISIEVRLSSNMFLTGMWAIVETPFWQVASLRDWQLSVWMHRGCPETYLHLKVHFGAAAHSSLQWGELYIWVRVGKVAVPLAYLQLCWMEPQHTHAWAIPLLWEWWR